MSDKIQQKNIDNKEGIMSIPNIFSYATKELSQDAFICWLIACASEATGPLRKCGLAFVRALFRAGGLNGTRNIPVLDSAGDPMAPYNGRYKVSDVGTPKRQYKNIDVYFQAKVDGEMVSFIIEDKIDSQPGEDQLKGYLDSVINDDQEEDLIKPVYFKTGYVFNYEREDVEENNYSVFDSEDLKKFLDSHPKAIRQNQILCHYAEYLNGKIEKRADALANWDLGQDYVQWEFMLKLRDVLRGTANHWLRFVPKALSNFQHGWGDNHHYVTFVIRVTNFQHGWGDSLSRGTSRGRPFTQYWFSTHLEWRLNAGEPLRLAIFRENPGGSREVSNDIVYEYRKHFQKVLQQVELSGGVSGKVKNTQECTIGFIDTANFQGLTEDEFLNQVKRVHIRFLESISQIYMCRR